MPLKSIFYKALTIENINHESCLSLCNHVTLLVANELLDEHELNQ